LTAQVRLHGWAWRQARRPWPRRAKQRGSGNGFRVRGALGMVDGHVPTMTGPVLVLVMVKVRMKCEL